MKKLVFLCSIILIMIGAFASAQATDFSSPKEVVTSFFELGFVERNPVEAAQKYISAKKYIQHNPHGADGRQAFIDGFAAYIVKSEYSCELKRAIAEGNLVAIHSHCKENAADSGAAIVDIFRVESGLIVEHWDVEQLIPEKSENKNTMF